MASARVKGLLRTVGLLEPALKVRRRLGYYDDSFRPCTPHLLVAISRALDWYRGGATRGNYLEFGMYRGFSMWYAQAIAADMGIDTMRFFGFDSFAGLPEIGVDDAGGEFSTGAYSCSRARVEEFLNHYGVDWNRTKLIEGWYNQSLTDETARVHQIENAAICVIDCDLYESTRDVLKFLQGRLANPAMLIFDDWTSYNNSPQKGEQRAFAEFLKAEPLLTAEEVLAFGGHGKSFIVRRAG